MIVMKFGGTSVEDAGAFRRVADIVQGERARSPIVVVSACAGVTNGLLAAARIAAEGKRSEAMAQIESLIRRHVVIAGELFADTPPEQLLQQFRHYQDELSTFVHGIGILGELTPRSLDLVASYGEMMSSLLLTTYLHARGMAAQWVNAQSFMTTDQAFTKAVPHLPSVETHLRVVMKPSLEQGRIPVTQGFIGATSDGVPTTIGRGGSDYSAALIGALLDAEEIQIWTDVDGILTADPSIVEGARKIRLMSFAEASELAYFGARVLHPDAILPAIERSIPVRVLNSRRPDGTGTLIVARSRSNDVCVVKSVAYKEGVTLISIVSSRMFLAHGFLEEVFDVFHKYRTVVHTVATSDVSASATINDTVHLDAIVEDLSRFASVTVASHKAIVCVVGENLRNSPGVAGRVLNSIGDTNINMISQGASEINISFVVDEAAINVVVQRLHDELFRNAESFSEVFE